MGNFSNNAITDVGKMLLADVQAGAVFVATRIVIGSGNMTGGATAQSMTAVITPVTSLAINKKKRTPDGKCVFGGVYTNADVTEAFYFRELALYAKAVYLNEDGSVKSEGAEVLYSYGNAGATADYMPAYSTSTVVEKQIDLVTWVGNDAQVDLTIESGMYITREVFNSHAARHAVGGEDPITPASIGAAPSGYGLGEINSANWSNIDNLVDNGWYIFEGETTIGGVYLNYAHMRVDAWNKDNLRQTMYPVLSNNPVLRRQKYGNEWQEWEWENPPMVAGVEYRTTERYAGAAVYKKVDTVGNVLWRKDGENQWHLFSSASYVSPATIE